MGFEIGDFRPYCDSPIALGASAKGPFRYDAALHRGIIETPALEEAPTLNAK